MLWFRRKQRPSAQAQPWSLDTRLFQWTAGAPFSIADACMGVGIFGTSGAGKTTGSYSTLLRSYLHAGFGGVFFTVKPEDSKAYLKLVRDSGRLDDVLIFSPEHTLRYNFIAEELRSGPSAAGIVENMSSLILTAVELLDRTKGGEGGDNARFFKLESQRLLRNAILAVHLAKGTFSVSDIHEFIVCAPRSSEEVLSESWRNSSFCYRCIQAADRAPKSESMKADFELALTYLLNEWPNQSARTRSSVQATLTSATDLLCRGAVRDMLSAPHSDVSAGMLHDGAILIVDFPVLRWALTGQLLQVILKYSMQRAHARRDVSANARPTFMAADEAQFLLVDEDQHFQSISRSTRTAMVYATQSISSMLDTFGPRSEDKVHCLLGNLATRICHQQTDVKTVAYMQQLIGRSRQWLMNGSSQSQGDWVGSIFGESSGASAGFSEVFENELNAHDFNTLTRGGPPHWLTEAIVYQGRMFPNGKTWIRAAIPQDH